MKKLFIAIGLLAALAGGWTLRQLLQGDNQQQDAVIKIVRDDKTSPPVYTLHYKLAKGDQSLRLRGDDGTLRFVLENFPQHSMVRITAMPAKVFHTDRIEVADDDCGVEFVGQLRDPSAHVKVEFGYELKIGSDVNWTVINPLDPHAKKGGPTVVVDGGN